MASARKNRVYFVSLLIYIIHCHYFLDSETDVSVKEGLANLAAEVIKIRDALKDDWIHFAHFDFLLWKVKFQVIRYPIFRSLYCLIMDVLFYLLLNAEGVLQTPQF